MKYPVDLHTHTIVSGHAYTTLTENINFAIEKGLKVLGTSEHAPTMPGAPHIWYFENIMKVPRKIKDLIILRGCEANIIDYEGNIDIDSKGYASLDYMLASVHKEALEGGTIEENTRAYIKVLDNPMVFILGHIGNPIFPVDYEAVVKAVKEKDKIIEINNASFGSSRVGSKENCIEVAKLCKKYGAKVILSSDAHICYDIGNFSVSEEILDSIEFPQELIMNVDCKIIDYLKSKGRLEDL